MSLLDGHTSFLCHVDECFFRIYLPKTLIFKSLIHTFDFVLSISLLHCPSLMFYLLVMILKQKVHLKYHVAVMGALSKKRALKDSLSTAIKVMLCWLRTFKQMTVFPKLKQHSWIFFLFYSGTWETFTKSLAHIVLTRSLLVTKMFDFGTKPFKRNDLLSEFCD